MGRHCGLTRRHLLRRAGLACGAPAGAALANLLLPPRAAQAADYKALVCIFLYGGNDGLNTVVPTDATRYAQYSAVRAGLALPRSSLVPLAGSDYGLHPSLAALEPVWRGGRLAPLFNAGPLHAPLSKAEYRSAAANSALVPDGLFSHADQQVLWETGSSRSLTRTGWGGRAVDVLGTANPVISVGGNGHFGLSAMGAPLVLPGPGAVFGAYELGTESWRLGYPAALERASALRELYRQGQDSDLGDAYAGIQRDAFAKSERLAALVGTQPRSTNANAAIDAGFAPLIANGQIATGLGRQLYQVAKLIAANATVGGNRQIFFAQLGGFDTHGNQVADNATRGVHAGLLKELGGAMAAFDAAMVRLGLSNAVTSFTQSDFGRSFKPNASRGTDHAWGNHHLVIGGAVKGRATYGRYPDLQLGGRDDVGTGDAEPQGRWIPGLSVDQYAATLLAWFGASAGQLDAILPNLRNFGSTRTLGFL